MAGTPAPRQAARLRGPLRPAPLAAASEKLLQDERPATRAATLIDQRAWLSRGGRARQPDKTQLRLIVLCVGVGSPTQRQVARLRCILSSVVRAGSLERPPTRNPSTLVGCQGAVSVAGRQPGAEERFFRALRPGLRRECPPPAIDCGHANSGGTYFLCCRTGLRRRIQKLRLVGSPLNRNIIC